MTPIQVELYTPQGNYAVLRLPARSYPGILFQGDTLFSLVAEAKALVKQARRVGDEAMIESTTALLAELASILSHYEAVIAQNDLRLPYFESNSSGVDTSKGDGTGVVDEE